MIIYALGNKVIQWPTEDKHDPDEEKYYGLNYFPETRDNSKSYTQGVDVVVFSTDNGCMYECISGGITAAAEPTIPTVEGKTFTDGTVKWLCKPLTTTLGFGDSISASIWTGDTGVTFSDAAIVNMINTEVKVTAIPASVTKFTITNDVDILYSSGKTEKRQRSIIISVKEL